LYAAAQRGREWQAAAVCVVCVEPDGWRELGGTMGMRQVGQESRRALVRSSGSSGSGSGGGGGSGDGARGQ
jgi:hypothetical protein